MRTSVTNFIRRDNENAFRFLTSAFASYAVMDRSQFETLVGELEQLRTSPTSPRRAAHFPPFSGFYGTLRICIVKEGENDYRLIANWVGDCLCVMTGDEFNHLTSRLRRLLTGDQNGDVDFPDYTYTITG